MASRCVCGGHGAWCVVYVVVMVVMVHGVLCMWWSWCIVHDIKVYAVAIVHSVLCAWWYGV